MLKIANHTYYHKDAARRLVESLKGMTVTPDLTLEVTDESIILHSEIQSQPVRFEHSFTSTRWIKRVHQPGQALLKAFRAKKNPLKRIYDLTLGWGRDSVLLMANGFKLVSFEHNPLFYHLLVYLRDIAIENEYTRYLSDWQLKLVDASEVLDSLTDDEPHGLYLDLMFPVHKSTAKPGKDLQLLQQYSDNMNESVLIEKVFKSNANRLVVKRPLHAPFINERKPDICYREKTVRFDVYLPGSGIRH